MHTPIRTLLGTILAITCLLFTSGCSSGGGHSGTGASGSSSPPAPPTFTIPESQQVQDMSPHIAPPFITTVQHVSIAKNFDDVVLLNPAYGDVWAGAIVGARSLMGGNPQQISAYRKPIEVAVLGLQIPDNTRTVTDPWAGSIDSAISDILNKGLPDASQSAQISVDYTDAYSNQQVAFQSGLTGVAGKFELGLGFNFGGSTETTSIAIKVTQVYYRVQVRLLNNYMDYVRDGTSFTDLTKNLSSNDYPAIISEITYGRILLFQMTSSKGTSTDKMAASFKAFVFNTGNVSDELTKIWRNSDLRLLVLGGAVPQVVIPPDPATLINTGSLWGKNSAGFPLLYKSNLLADGLPHFSYGLTTEFNTYKSSLMQGDNLWNQYSFSADYGHDNNFKLNRDGSPVAGSANAPGPPGLAPGGPWENRMSVGGNGGGLGSLAISFPKDSQVYADTWLFVKNDTLLSNIRYDSDVGRVWLNDVEVTQNPLTLSLKAGIANHLEVTAYNQNDTTKLTIGDPIAMMVDAMDSNKLGATKSVRALVQGNTHWRHLLSSGRALSDDMPLRWRQRSRLNLHQVSTPTTNSTVK